MAWIGQNVGTTAATMTATSFFHIVFGSSWLFIVFAEDIANDAAAFNKKNIKKSKASDLAELMERFCAIVRCYSEVKL